MITTVCLSTCVKWLKVKTYTHKRQLYVKEFSLFRNNSFNMMNQELTLPFEDILTVKYLRRYFLSFTFKHVWERPDAVCKNSLRLLHIPLTWSHSRYLKHQHILNIYFCIYVVFRFSFVGVMYIFGLLGTHFLHCLLLDCSKLEIMRANSL